MENVDTILAVVSILSFLLAVFAFVRNEIKKAAEKANVEVMREKIESLYQGLVSVYYSTDAIIQVPKTQRIDVATLQNLGRISRAQVFILLKKIEKERLRLKEWKFGTMIQSEPPEDIDIENTLDGEKQSQSL